MLRRTYILPIIDIMRRLIDFFLVMVFLSLHLRAENWMARLPDDALVADLSIPGAHDAATGSGWAGLNGPVGNLFAKTQDLDLLSLWQAGIRAFDLRPAVYKHHMNLNHGMMPTKLHLEDVLTMMQTWLRQNPSEFIIIHLLHAGDGDKVKGQYEQRIAELLNQPVYRETLADFQADLRVRDMRGKMLILSRNNYNGTPVGGIFRNWTGSPDWRRQTLGRIVGSRGEDAKVYMQDFSSTYAPGALDIKLAALRRMLEFSTSKKSSASDGSQRHPLTGVNGGQEIVWVLNFCSAYSKVTKLFGHDISRSNGYRDNAAHTHAAMLDYLRTRRGPTGIVLMDFAAVDRSHGYNTCGMELVRAIIDSNF